MKRNLWPVALELGPSRHQCRTLPTAPPLLTSRGFLRGKPLKNPRDLFFFLFLSAHFFHTFLTCPGTRVQSSVTPNTDILGVTLDWTRVQVRYTCLCVRCVQQFFFSAPFLPCPGCWSDVVFEKKNCGRSESNPDLLLTSLALYQLHQRCSLREDF